MNKVYKLEIGLIKSWVTDIEEGALEQAKTLAELPYTYKHVALMPDCHQGYGMPIGGVLATYNNIVIPNAVGVDIGCGMRVIKTHLKDLDLPKFIKDLDIPLGFNKHANPVPAWSEFKDNIIADLRPRDYINASLSLGTLGGGNHFIEVQKDPNGYIYVMLHSGSRNFGKVICDYYNRIAEETCKRNYSIYKKDLAFLTDSDFDDYMNDMLVCVAYAKKNRELMMQRVIEVLPECTVPYELDVPHNYAIVENFGIDRVVVHRKGAISAKLGELGIIPGSQGTSSYIVKGLGNTDAYCSCSHGAGRRMGRNVAKKTLNLEEQKELMKGVVCNLTTDTLDEAPGAYKDIDEVMQNQKDLVEILLKLTPLASIKG